MTREEEIKQATEIAWTRVPDIIKRDFIMRTVFNQGAYELAKWADEHPKSPWISVEERLPIKECDYYGNKKCVFVKVYNFEMEREWIEQAASYSKRHDDWQFANSTWLKPLVEGKDIMVTHWMPIPELKED